MIEQEIGRIILIIEEMTIRDQQQIRLKDVLSSDIPRGVKSYLAAEAVRWLRDDVRGAEHFRRLDPDSTSVPQIMKSFLRSIAPEYTFSQEEFRGLVHGGVHLCGNYLCRPQETLTQFVFQNRERIGHDELTQLFEYFVDYAYLTTLLDSYLVKNAMTEISLAHFKLLISRLDERVVREHNARELAKLVKPLFDFLLFGSSTTTDTIPLEPILAFFDDKKMVILREYIERICVIRGKATLSRKELTGIVQDLYEDDDAPTLGLLRGAQSRREEQRAPQPEPAAGPPSPADVEPPAPEQTELTLVTPVDQEESSPDVDSDGAAMTEPSDTTSTQAPPQEDGSLADLHAIISEGRRSLFIKKIFRKDEAYYNTIIQSLNEAATWKEASQNLNTLFLENNIDPFTAIVVEFTDTIHSRYLPTSPP